MHDIQTIRKARFRAALALAGSTAEQWAEQSGVTPSHLSRVLAGERCSKALTDKIDAFIKTYVRTPRRVSA